jgi:hypothetical protein
LFGRLHTTYRAFTYRVVILGTGAFCGPHLKQGPHASVLGCSIIERGFIGRTYSSTQTFDRRVRCALKQNVLSSGIAAFFAKPKNRNFSITTKPDSPSDHVPFRFALQYTLPSKIWRPRP